ncbi:MAG: zinc-ribbon domain containing protein [Dehalococcoidia bacterium]|nr:zinc-ribbon domain containing protein [Dehalococcoidia bacterium]
MSVETQPIVCSLCAAAFSFTDDEKQFQMIRSIVGKPVLCPRCRGANLNERSRDTRSRSSAWAATSPAESVFNREAQSPCTARSAC